ncbi:hypothetical protein [Clostridium sp. AWRP]|nr:hypothetical protein [Clostridium sp. AWRP]
MDIKDFYRKKIVEIENAILNAENEKDFKKTVKLQVEKANYQKRLNE